MSKMASQDFRHHKIQNQKALSIRAFYVFA